MTISTTALANHKVIVTNTNLQADIKYLLTGSATGNAVLSTLCKSTAINRWAKYKPVKYASDAPSRSGTWWKGVDQNCGINVSYYTTIQAMLNAWIAKTNYAWTDFWAYDPPTGGTYPYRELDFLNYCHKHTSGEDYDKPFPNYSMPTDVIRYYFDSKFTIGAIASISNRTFGNTYLLKFDDINIKQGNGYLDLASMYFSMAFVYKYDSSANVREYSFQSTYCNFKTDATSDTHDGSYGKTIRQTPNFLSTSLNYNGSYLALPFLSSVRLWDTGSSSVSNPTYLASNNAALTTSGLYVPLPYAGKVITVTQQTVTIALTLTISRTASGTLKMTLKATNKTSSKQTLAQSYLTYDVLVYPKDSSGSTEYQSSTEYTSTWGTTESSINANSSITLTKTINYTEYSNYGGFISATVYASMGYISSSSASLDY